MTSNSLAQCCTVGVKHEGTATGEMIEIDGTEVYIARPKNPKPGAGILFLSDVLGHNFINAQLMVDQYAANGYLTLMPNILHDDPVPLNRPADWDAAAYVAKHGIETVDPVIESTIKYMKTQLGVQKLAGAGYCFGGKYVARFLAKGKGLDVGFSAHPSLTTVEELKAVAGPYSIAAAEIDNVFSKEKRRESADILETLSPLPYEMRLWGGAAHGYAVRGDIKNKRVKYAKEQTFLQAVNWIDYYLLSD